VGRVVLTKIIVAAVLTDRGRVEVNLPSRIQIPQHADRVGHIRITVVVEPSVKDHKRNKNILPPPKKELSASAGILWEIPVEQPADFLFIPLNYRGFSIL
jgi:hypothetical protein